MSIKHDIPVEYGIQEVERSLKNALTELWRDPPKLKRGENRWTIYFPSLGRGNPAYYLHIDIMPEGRFTKIRYWQSRGTPRIDLVIALVSAGSLLYILSSRDLLVLFPLVALPIAFLASVSLLIGRQERTKQLVSYAFTNK
jgi:hypothetical protein